jgi:hypothetical protein
MLYGEEAEGRLGPWGFGVFGVFVIFYKPIIGTDGISFKSKFMNLKYLKQKR